jgi:hypothetical protein
MGRTQGLFITFTRCNDAQKEAEWDAWYDNVHVPDAIATGAVWAVTRWELLDRPALGYPAVGFTHVNIFEMEGPDLEDRVRRFRENRPKLVRAGRMHPNQTAVQVAALRAFGRWNEKPEPSAKTTGHILTFVLCNDPDLEDEWNPWLDDVHVPDMLSSGAFSAASRWQKLERDPYGPNYMTLYDIEHADLAEAGRLSGAVMPKIIAAGRKMTCHAGGLTVVLKPAGKWGAAGYRAGQPSP